MAYDEELADRVRAILSSESGVREQRMFGGLAFLVDNTLCVSVSRQGGLLARADPGDVDRFVSSGRAAVAVMGGREMRGWVRLAPDQLRTQRQLAAWVRRGVEQARSLAGTGSRRPRRRGKPRRTSGPAA